MEPRRSYADALQSAVEALRARGIARAAELAGCAESGGSAIVPFIGRIFEISSCGESATEAGGGRPAAVFEHILLLHYLATADGSEVSAEETSFREIPGAGFYDAVFSAHAIHPLAGGFGEDGSAFETACRRLGGRRLGRGGVAMRIDALPRVPVVVTFWPGEEEMPSGAGMVFSKSVTSYLPLEDVAVLGEHLCGRILAGAGIASGNSARLYEYE